MKYILILILLSSCLTPKRFNKIVDKAEKKGWINSKSIELDTTIITDTLIQNNYINKILNETVLKDTCFSKEQKFIGFKSNPEKLKEELKIFKCLNKPLFFKENDIIIELYQDSLGQFKVKASGKTTNIQKQKEINYFKDVWFLWLIIVILIIIIVLKK